MLNEPHTCGWSGNGHSESFIDRNDQTSCFFAASNMRGLLWRWRVVFMARLQTWFQEGDGVHPHNNSKREKATNCPLLDFFLFLLLWSKLFAEETKHWAAIIDCSSWSVFWAWEHCGEVVSAQDNIAVRVEPPPPPFTVHALAKCQMQNISAADGFSPLSVKKSRGVGGGRHNCLEAIQTIIKSHGSNKLWCLLM